MKNKICLIYFYKANKPQKTIKNNPFWSYYLEKPQQKSFSYFSLSNPKIDVQLQPLLLKISLKDSTNKFLSTNINPGIL